MYSPFFQLRSFDRLNQDLKSCLIERLTDALAMVDLAYLRENPKTPKLYDLYQRGRVYYKEMPGQGQDKLSTDPWFDIPRLLEVGYGDCKQLVAWRMAELLFDKSVPKISAYVTWKAHGRMIIYHVRMKYPNGLIECPSTILGMGQNGHM